MNYNLIKRLKSAFYKEFLGTPIVAFAPGRINLIGEHTDYNGGHVLPAAIGLGIYTAMSKNKLTGCRVLSLSFNERYEFDIRQLAPFPRGHWGNYLLGVLHQLVERGYNVGGFDMVFDGDIPVGSGLSSSAALENSIVMGLNALFGLRLSKIEMISISQQAEHSFTGVKCGIMDQYASMFGRKGHAFLLNCETMGASHVRMDLQGHELVLINSHVHHKLSDSVYNARREICERVADKLGATNLSKISEGMLIAQRGELTEEELQKSLYVVQENERTNLAFQALKRGQTVKLGSLMYTSHYGLQYQYQVSCNEIDFLVAMARKSSSFLGSRLMGGGFGGCTLNLVRKGCEKELILITDRYLDRTGITPSIIPVDLGDGAKILEYET